MDTKSYHWDAKKYAACSSPQKEWAMELIVRLDLQGSERVLDIGCGDGKVTVEIARALPEGSVVGIDSSKEMIELASSRYSGDNFQNVHFRQVDARSLPFHDEFDVVFSNATLHWIRNHFPVLRGISRSLKKGGNILIQMGGKGNGADIFRATKKVIRSDKWKEYFTDFSFPYAFYDAGQYRRWLEKTGLRPVRVELIPREMIHESPAALTAWLQNVFLPYTERIPRAKRRSFLEEIIEKFLEQHPVDEKGQTHVHMVRLEVEAKKENV